MTAARFARLLLLLSPALGLVAAVIWFVAKPIGGNSPSGDGGEPAADKGGKLVVFIVFDQMRGDYLERWKQHYGSDGFEKLKRDGVWFSNAHVPYAASSTAPGHSSLSTGAPPSVHGIIENKWFERSRGKVVTSCTTDEAYERVPPGGNAVRDKWPALAPTRLLAPTVGDALLEQRKGESRVFSLSLKDRTAVLMGGKEPNGVYCYDASIGEFHTSSYYRKSLPAWVDAFDRARVVYRWGGKTWDRFKQVSIYDALGPDDMPGEGGRSFMGQRVFPHRLPEANDRSVNYFDALEYSAYGNDLLWEFVKAAIEGENVGRNGTTDLLCVSFSTNDMIGHAFGPDSHEVLDITLRSDKLMADVLVYLDQRVGRDRYSLVMTADHGVCPLPEVAVKTHPEARRLSMSDFIGGLDEHLDKVFGKKDDVPGQWVERDAPVRDCYPWIYLNRRTIEALDKTYPQVEEAAAAWLRERPTPLTVFTRTQLLNGTFPTAEKDFGAMAQLSFHPDRSGDLYIIAPAYNLVLGAISHGTDHGTPHEYDRHIPILAYGADVPRLGERKDAVSSLSIAPYLAQLLGISPPAKAYDKSPAALAR
ncbi:alkaline phosphatase family protein [Limnoglobus roseus]|uniref:Alkaline phosphatase family protein n=1 Tax=Limnoglobus roseus TaxID=2598579 RepID=A0A5C1AHX7_9BACT|nr:alkaline phosphatase family protein [Limnoglobus roseus]QEL18440.1 alkaline phosphatase family protein [Limnoglobus roseus]